MRKITDNWGEKLLFFDGGMGTMLQARGLRAGELPETWNLSHGSVLQDIHKSYLEAGADVLTTNTFGACGLKYKGAYCPEGFTPIRSESLGDIVTAAVENARAAVEDCPATVSAGSRPGPGQRRAYVALDLGPTGQLLAPLGRLAFEEAVSLYAETVRIGAAAGADLVLIETMTDLYELKAAVLAAKENCDLPILATAVFGENGHMLTGADPAAAAVLLAALGASAAGINCGLGPEQMLPLAEQMAAVSDIPLIINPNAGLPHQEDGRTVYNVGPEQFAEQAAQLVQAGAWGIGGCCGTTPAHIAALTERLRGFRPVPVEPKHLTAVTSGSRTVFIDTPKIIGERINPTGKKKLREALKDRNFEYILEEAFAQQDKGADILDVNVGTSEVDEKEMLPEVVRQLQEAVSLPLQLDTSDPEAMERALRIYNGKPLMNSVNGKQESMAAVFPLAKKYGGVVVALALDESGIPADADGRVAIIDKITKTAASYGIGPENILADALTMTVSTDAGSAAATLETVRQITARGGRTVLGVSNISFGLPQRELLNATFLSMAMAAGLSAAILNPGSVLMRQAFDASRALTGQDTAFTDFIARYAAAAPAAAPVSQPADGGKSGTPSAAGPDRNPAGGSSAASASSGALPQSSSASSGRLLNYVCTGQRGQAAAAAGQLLASMAPLDIINMELVPALNRVGADFEKGTLFLPQLLMSAEAAQAAFAEIRRSIPASQLSAKKARIVLATVKGDIHDIGKNIVRVLLENYDYDVIDLGRDVSEERILEMVLKEDVPLVGLSALMTTTAVNMESTIRLLHREAPGCRIMVGGAVLTQEYADRIGADFYGRDAMASVYYAEGLFH